MFAPKEKRKEKKKQVWASKAKILKKLVANLGFLLLRLGKWA